MPDRYQELAKTPIGKFVVSRLGLPNPRPLPRHAVGDPLLAGRVLIGGDGRLREPAAHVAQEAGGQVTSAIAHGERVHALVFDASAIDSVDGLVDLYEFFSPVVRSLTPAGRIVVLGTPPSLTTSASAQIAQRALEGFTRSVGKEVGRGSTVQLVYVAPGAEDRMTSTLEFLLSPKSAYVSGQVVRIGLDVAAPDRLDRDPARPLAGTAAIVTGAARGIGAEIARVLTRDGAAVVGVDVPQAASDLQALMDELGGARLSLDITAPDAAKRMAALAADKHGGVDVIVHNAGITRDKLLANLTRDRWTSVLDVNVRAPEAITREFLDQGLIRPNGRVVGVSSIAGIAGNRGQTNYATSKAGVIGLVGALAPEAADRQLTVNAVAPAFIETQMTASIPLFVREAGRRMNSMAQGGLPVDVAETVAWLADPGSYGVTGQVVRVCGQSLLGA
jgi:3-oxoacyl-[acyl-carrier protein] reductase